jgi:pimeloyl-ACP methyl ester carboxylesterase
MNGQFVITFTLLTYNAHQRDRDRSAAPATLRCGEMAISLHVRISKREGTMIRRAIGIAVFTLGMCVCAMAQPEAAAPYAVKFFDFFAENRPVRMAYRDVPAVGKANGGTVLLVHGENFSGTYWEKTAQVLAAHGFRVVIPDQLGFGASSRLDLHYSFGQLSENTFRLLSYLGVHEVEVLGHSMGGMLAVRFTLLHPTMVKKLILEDPIGLEDYRTFLPYVPLENEFQIELHATYDTYLTRHKTFYVNWKPEYESYVREEARFRDTGEFPEAALVAALAFEMIYEEPVVYELADLRVPTLIVIGAEDRPVVGEMITLVDKPKDMPGMDTGSMMPQDRDILRTAGAMPAAYQQRFGPYQALAQKAHEAVKNSTLVQIPDTGHIPHLESPDKFYQTILPFLTR